MIVPEVPFGRDLGRPAAASGLVADPGGGLQGVPGWALKEVVERRLGRVR